MIIMTMVQFNPWMVSENTLLVSIRTISIKKISFHFLIATSEIVAEVPYDTAVSTMSMIIFCTNKFSFELFISI